MRDRMTVHDILCGGQGKIDNTVLQEWTENMHKANSSRALFFTVKVLVEVLLILTVIIQVQFKSLRQYF